MISLRSLKKLYEPPTINPKTGKALSIPVFNLFDPYGRNFNLAWLGFFVSFLSWFAFPPLMAHSIKVDLGLTAKEVANNNIAGLSATLIGRVIMGPICDKIGPRYGMIIVLVVGSVPTAFVPLVHNINALHAIRFFIGLLGSSFIACQHWTTTYFDKSIVGTANAFAGGFGNAGGGVAFFVMPAIRNGLLDRGYTKHQSWSYAFVIGPFLILVAVALLCLIFGQDCPEGKWSQRGDILHIGVDVRKVEIVSITSNHPVLSNNLASRKSHIDDKIEQPAAIDDKLFESSSNIEEHLDVVQTRVSDVVNLEEIIEDPTLLGFLRTTFHYRTMLVALPYVVTFGGELAIESVLSALYINRSTVNGDAWNESKSGSWASMIGLLNVVTRPFGGIMGDYLYGKFKTTKAKKFWLIFCAVMEGIFLIWIGFIPASKLKIEALIASISIMCIFMEAGNGACFALVPHINPKSVGIVSGTVGAFGNLGGILFALVFRFNISSAGVTEYMKGFWIIGVCSAAIGIVCCFIPVREDRPDSYIEKSEKSISA